MGRNHLAGSHGDAANAVLAAARMAGSLVVRNPGRAHPRGRSQNAPDRGVTAFFSVDFPASRARDGKARNWTGFAHPRTRASRKEGAIAGRRSLRSE
jgi:hypothetical protein